MKVSKILMSGALALGLSSAAHADTTIYITGSTAFRSAVKLAIDATYGGGLTASAQYDGSSAGGANEMYWKGTFPGISGVTTVKAVWSGSVAGVRAVDTGIPIGNFIADNPRLLGFNGTITPAANGTDATLYDQATHSCQLAMSDSFQKATVYNSHQLLNTNVGVVPFVWIKNNGLLSDSHWANLTNVVDCTLRVLLTGPIPLSMFTGSTNDWNGNEPLVYAVGRNDDSGTRLAAFADTLFGIFTAPDQFDISGTNASSITIAQDTQVDGTGNPAQPGTQGYNSGGKVATAMKVPGSATANQDGTYGFGTGWYAIAYVGLSDASNAVGGGAAYLTYNGVPYSPANVQNGPYQFWAYEHILGIQGLSGDPLTFYKNLAGALRNGNYETTSGAGFEISTMNVSRTSDGGPVTYGNIYN